VIEVVIDPDLKVGANSQLTFIGYSDVAGGYAPEVGTTVRAYSRYDGSTTTAIVVAVNHPAMLVYLAVAWAEFVPSEAEVSTSW
jgi:hypothetical protein